MQTTHCQIVQSPFTRATGDDDRVVVCIPHKTFHVCRGGNTCIPVECPHEGFYCAKSKMALSNLQNIDDNTSLQNRQKEEATFYSNNNNNNGSNNNNDKDDGDEDYYSSGGVKKRKRRRWQRLRQRRKQQQQHDDTSQPKLLHMFMNKLRDSVDGSFTEKQILNMYGMVLHASRHFCKHIDYDTLTNMMIYTLESTQTLELTRFVKNKSMPQQIQTNPTVSTSTPSSTLVAASDNNNKKEKTHQHCRMKRKKRKRRCTVRGNRRLQIPHRLLKNYDLSKLLLSAAVS